MTDILRDALREDADAVTIPTIDATDVIAKGEQRLHRRRMAAGLAAVAAVAAIAIGSVVVTRADPNTQEPPPVAPPSSPEPSDGAVDPRGTRPLVYAEGSTVHVGDKTVQAKKPVAFIDATDDGAVYEAMLDGTLWFTDGTTTSVIGRSGCTACPTAHAGVVRAGDSGSLVVWADLTGRRDKSRAEYVVYDTSRREEVARIPIAGPDSEVAYVDGVQVWITAATSAHQVRLDAATGETTRFSRAELDAELGKRSRMFLAEGNDPDPLEPDTIGHGFTAGARFRQVDRRLVPVTSGGDPIRLTRANGDEVRLRVPNGYVMPGAPGSGGISTSQWLDDDHVVLWADDGGGDLPAKEGDLLVCRLPDGTCRVAVARSSDSYVVP